MKRVLFGVIWFFVLAILGLVGGGAVVGYRASSTIQATNAADGFSKGMEAGRTAGAEFTRTYGGVVVLSALALSILGTVFRVLPGTRRP